MSEPAPSPAVPFPRPDPSLGVFETILVLDGRPIELEAHLARLHASLAALFPTLTPPPLDVPVIEHLYGPQITGTSEIESLRVTVAPGADGRLALRTKRRQAPCVAFVPDSDLKATQASLASLVIRAGLGQHKWVDRSLLDEAQAQLPNDTLALLVDEDGAVLEASRANVFAVRDGVLLTPPLDGRILPGVTRMRVLELAEEIGIDAREAELFRGDLLDADEVFLTGSVRGIERVDQIDGTPLRTGGEIADRLATELWRGWADAKTASLR